MATLTIRNLNEDVKQSLRLRAARHSRSMEAEARAILEEVLSEAEDETDCRALFERIRARFEPLGGVELEPLPREPVREPPSFDR